MNANTILPTKSKGHDRPFNTPCHTEHAQLAQITCLSRALHAHQSGQGVEGPPPSNSGIERENHLLSTALRIRQTMAESNEQGQQSQEPNSEQRIISSEFRLA